MTLQKYVDNRKSRDVEPRDIVHTSKFYCNSHPVGFTITLSISNLGDRSTMMGGHFSIRSSGRNGSEEIEIFEPGNDLHVMDRQYGASSQNMCVSGQPPHLSLKNTTLNDKTTPIHVYFSQLKSIIITSATMNSVMGLA